MGGGEELAYGLRMETRHYVRISKYPKPLPPPLSPPKIHTQPFDTQPPNQTYQEQKTNPHSQPQPQAAITLIHQQPVRWTHERKVSCDGGGGPLGHPRIFINVDRPQICHCTYCGLPFVRIYLSRPRFLLSSLPITPLPPAHTTNPPYPSLLHSLHLTPNPIRRSYPTPLPIIKLHTSPFH